jgi:hypothetical protein
MIGLPDGAALMRLDLRGLVVAALTGSGLKSAL